MYKYKNLKKIGIQFFAEPKGDPEGGNPNEDPEGGDPEGDDPDGGNGGSDKTFTQDEVNKLMSREKRKGKASLLRELGLDPEDKDAVKNLKALLESQKTDKQKQQEDLKKAQDSAAQETTRANAAERKLKVLMVGCQKDYVDEVTTLAAAKVNDDTDFDEALEEVKKKFPAMFGESDEDQDKGTGRGQGHKRQKANEKPGSFGARLAQSNAAIKDNPYFKD